MKEKQKTHVNRKEKGEIMSPGRWEPLQGELLAWAKSSRRPEMRGYRLLFVTECHYGPDEGGRPAFGGRAKQLTIAEFSREYDVTRRTLYRWRKEMLEIADQIEQEYHEQQENKQTEAEDVQAAAKDVQTKPAEPQAEVVKVQSAAEKDIWDVMAEKKPAKATAGAVELTGRIKKAHLVEGCVTLREGTDGKWYKPDGKPRTDDDTPF